MTAAPSTPVPYAPVRPAPSFTQSLSPSQRRTLGTVLAILRSLSLFALCLLASMCALGYHFGHEQALKISNPVLDVTGFVVGLALLVTVFLRRRWPVAITVVSALAGIGVYLDTTVGLFRDASQGSTGNSIIGAFNSAPPHPSAVTHVSVLQVLFLAVVAMSLPVAVGLWLRARDGEKKARRRAQEAADASAQAERAAQEQTRTSTRLADTVSLQAERERVAREVHDGLGHRLSLLALHAAALEQGVLETSESSNAPEGSQAPDSAGAVGEDDPRAAAQRVRQEAQGAMRDLRSLLAVLREPVGAVEPAPRLEDLREVVDGVLAARQPLSSSIYLDRAVQADEVLSRAVYRIVQESLTNARKHSPGTSVQLRVEGGPDTGIDITCSNRISRTEPEAPEAEAGEAPQASGADRSAASGPGVVVGDPQGGSGLRGMAQRAAICGGTFHAGPDGQGRFVVSAHLPWRSAESPRTSR